MIDVADTSYADEFRVALRDTWLRWVGQLGYGYKFFMLSVENTTRMLSLEREANAHDDMVFVKASDIWWQRGDRSHTDAADAPGGDR